MRLWYLYQYFSSNEKRNLLGTGPNFSGYQKQKVYKEDGGMPSKFNNKS